MIKFALRRNLIYPLQLMIWHLLRKLETMLISYLFNFGDSLIYTPLMFIGEFISGLIIFLYQKNFVKKGKEKKAPKFITETLLHNEITLLYPDKDFKIWLLIFFAAYFDWARFVISEVTVPKYNYISSSIAIRFCGILAISSAILYSFFIKIGIFKHQKFCLIVIGICTIIVLISEIFFKKLIFF